MSKPMSKSALKSIIALLAAPAAFTGLALPAAAQDDRPSVEVRYGDLDLASADGRERLQQRVDRAIARMCGTYPAQRQTLIQQTASRKCSATAHRDADDKLAALLDGSGARLAVQGGSVVAVR